MFYILLYWYVTEKFLVARGVVYCGKIDMNSFEFYLDSCIGSPKGNMSRMFTPLFSCLMFTLLSGPHVALSIRVSDASRDIQKE